MFHEPPISKASRPSSGFSSTGQNPRDPHPHRRLPHLPGPEPAAGHGQGAGGLRTAPAALCRAAQALGLPFHWAPLPHPQLAAWKAEAAEAIPEFPGESGCSANDIEGCEILVPASSCGPIPTRKKMCSARTFWKLRGAWAEHGVPVAEFTGKHQLSRTCRPPPRLARSLLPGAKCRNSPMLGMEFNSTTTVSEKLIEGAWPQ